MKREMMVYIPELKVFLYAGEGTGDNLLKEDIEEGFVDYVNIETYTYEDRQLVEDDGGMLMLTELFDDAYKDDDVGERLIKDVMDYMFECTDYAYVEIKEG